MSKTIFHAVPVMRCHCPAKHYQSEGQALEYTRKATNAFRVVYAVWRVRQHTLRLLRRVTPAHVQVRA
jgi:hypothetical protein